MASSCRWLIAACVLAAIGLVGACIEPALVPCGNQLCPSGDTCVANELCASAEQLAACTGVADTGSCTIHGGVGVCDRGVCVAAGCGNGVVDPGEACDDGNQVSGDGCRADCRKVEMCGDGVVDDGEGCDDGNANPADGCDACTPTTWRATVALGGSAGATSVGLASPSGVAVDLRGNVYIADPDNHRVRRVDASGVVTTLAGNGTPGSAGDGGPATGAQLTYPVGIAVDGLGNVYIADASAQRVRRVDATGTISTFAGNGYGAFSGDGGPATSAQLGNPYGVAVDGLGTVYIADSANQRIRRVDASGVITTFAGTGVGGFNGDGGQATSAQLHDPYSVALDGLGNVYVADTSNNRIRRIDASGVITTLAGTGVQGGTGDGGPATSAKLAVPFGVATDAHGNIYIADRNNHRVRRVDSTGTITTIGGNGNPGFVGDGGPATSARLYSPNSVAVDGIGNIYIADLANERIRRVDPTGVISTFAGTGTVGFGGDGGAATCAQLQTPYRVAADKHGNVYIADTYSHRIRRVDPHGVITTIAGTGAMGFSGDGGPGTSAQLFFPWGVAADGLGNVYIADNSNSVIRRVDATGVITTVAGGSLSGLGDNGPATSARLSSPVGVAADGLGTIYIADFGNHRIRRVDAAGVITTFAGNGTAGVAGDGGPATSAQVNPRDVALDGLGNVFIADPDNHRVRRVDAAGIITTVAGTGVAGSGGDGGPAASAQLNFPFGIAADGLGNLYISEVGNLRIRRVDATGMITTIAGSVFGFTGDGGAATAATLYDPYGVAADGLGNIYVADTSNNRIRHIDPGGIMSTVAGVVDPEAMGPLDHARLADPRAFVVAAPFTLFAGGATGTVQAAFAATQSLEVVAGRYPQPKTGQLARYGGQNFGTVSGVAYDAAAGLIYLTESTTNRLDVVTIVDPADARTWTIAALTGGAGTAGFADGSAATAKFRQPTGLYFDAPAHQLYVADTGNHVIRAIDLTGGVASATVRTVAGTPQTLGFFGDGSAATAALLYAPQAITRCGNGELFVADTGNHRVRRIAAGGTITTVLGVGVAASSGEGRPAATFPVDTPLGLACDAIGNLFVSSTTTVRLLPADANGIVDGTGAVQTIYGAPPRDVFPASVTTCLTGLAVIDATTIDVVDSCSGLLVELQRGAK